MSRIVVPQRAHPFVKTLFANMRDKGVTYRELESAGVKRATFKAWRGPNLNPTVDQIDKALAVVGLKLAVVPIEAR